MCKGNDLSALPSYSSPKQLAQYFSDFFINKIENRRNNIDSHSNNTVNKQPSNIEEDLSYNHPPVSRLDHFDHATEEKVRKIIQKLPNL